MFGAPLREMTGRIRRLRSSSRLGLESYPLSPSRASGRLRGRPGRPATGGMPSTRARVRVTSLTLAAVVMTLSGVPRPRRSGGVCCPFCAGRPATDRCRHLLFSRGCVSHPRRPVTSRVPRPRSVRPAESGATGQRRRPAATVPGGASRSARSRTPTPAAAVARLCRCRGRTGCPADTVGRPPAVAPAPARARPARPPGAELPHDPVEQPAVIQPLAPRNETGGNGRTKSHAASDSS
jgi:hypothetical protein